MFLLLTLAHGCSPSAFDRNGREEGADAQSELPGRQGEHDLDGSVGEHDARVAITDMDGAADVDADIDAAADAQTFDAEAGPEGPPDTSGPELDDGGCARVPRALSVSRQPIEVARLATPEVFQSRVLGPSAWLGTGRSWVIYSKRRR